MKPSTLEPSWQSAPMFVVAMLLAAGAFWATGPLEDQRPRQPGYVATISSKAVSIPKVDARLWQDPFAPVWRYDSKHPTAVGIADLKKSADEKCSPKSCVVMGVLVVGGPYVGMEEHRRATRYAVLAGLQQDLGSLEGGFVPEDPEHVSYVRLNHGELKTIVPFEWLKMDKGVRHLLLLWLDEEAFSARAGEVLSGLSLVFGNFSTSNHYKPILLGPTSSGTLQAMACSQVRGTPRQVMTGVQIYSALATSKNAWDSVTTGKNCPDKRPTDLRITRVNSTDDSLVDMLVTELVQYRHIGAQKSSDTVLLVGQRDTAYSRDLVEGLSTKFKDKDINVEVAYHLRGIDGRLPTSEIPSDGKKDKDNKTEKNTIERPEGDTQVDYLRRLAANWANPQNHDGSRIRAVGIVGNDYYDKLLALKALRPAFPHAVFFTTDLNASMLHPDDNRFTRGMLVASGLGLNLSHAIQNGIAPFRTNYQTATYLAARVAMENALHPRANDGLAINQGSIDERLHPMLFEIGRNTPVPLCVDSKSADPVCQVDTTILKSDNPWWGLSNWQPLPKVTRTSGYWLGIALAIIAVLTLPILLFTAVSAFVREYRILLAGLAVVTLSFVTYIALHMPRPLDEPFSWIEGISIWPTEILRVISIVLTLFLIHQGIKKLSAGDVYTAKQFHLPGGTVPPDRESQKMCDIWWLYQARGIAASKLDQWLEKQALPNSHVWNWRTVVGQTGLRVFIYLCFGAALYLVSGSVSPPARGASIILDGILTGIAVVLFPLLLFFVLDASQRATWLARKLSETNAWLPETLKEFGFKGEQCSRYSDKWLDVRLIAAATVETGKLVHYPFVVFFLLVVALSPLFDTWSLSWPLVTGFTLALVLMLSAGLRLRREAELVRSGALLKLEEDLLRVQCQAGNELLEKQIKTMTEQIRNLRTGVFLPFAQQPLVRAILGLVSGLSGLALLEYANLANL